ncbi:MAG: NAD(P)/FAD-dependent oxidoreductase [Myxococcales bacterium]|nr:NAD(P)/FAD-dependent oxidoreductase [Myxococcales bacterium]
MLGKLFDVAVIGTELAGLVAGALLVKRGFQVAVIDVENERQQVKRQGYTLKPFPGLFFGFGQNQVFNDIFVELGIPFLEKKRFQLAQPAYQIALPEARIDILQGREEWTHLLNLTFGADAGALTNLLNEADRYSSQVRSLLTKEVVYPAYSFMERYRLNRTSGNMGADFKERSRTSFDEFMDSFGLSAEARAFIEAQFYFLAPTYPDDPSLFFASLVLSALNKGIYSVEGGLRILEDICKERISSYRGQLQRAGEIEEIDFARVNEIKLAGIKEPVRCKKILVCNNIEEFFSRHSPKTLRGSYKERFEEPPHRRHLFTLYVGVKDEVIPVGMNENVILLTDTQKPATEPDNLAFASLSPLDSPDYAPPGKRLIAISTLVLPESGELNAIETRSLSDRMVAQLRELIPFLDEFTDFVAFEESFALYQASRRTPATPPISLEDKYGIACLPNRTPHKDVYYAGKATLPGMGMEGEGISAVMVTNLLAKALAK